MRNGDHRWDTDNLPVNVHELWRPTKPTSTATEASSSRSSSVAVVPAVPPGQQGGRALGLAPTVAPVPVHIVVESGPDRYRPEVRTAQTWTFRDLTSVGLAVALVLVAGLLAGALYGGTIEPEYAARSEFVYYLDNAVPDGFLREDRRILTQIVTIEGETVLGPVARDFEMTATDLAESVEVSVVDLSEVIRIDVTDEDQEWALAVNDALLARYQEVAELTDRRIDPTRLSTQREQVLEQLATADAAILSITNANVEDVELKALEEALVRELDLTVERVNRLGAIEDSLLTEVQYLDDRAALTEQLRAARATLRELEAELLTIRTRRSRVQQEVDRVLGSGVPFVDATDRDLLVSLGVREDSVSLEMTTVNGRIRTLEGLLAESETNQPSTVDEMPIALRLSDARALVADLETELVTVRTQRAELTKEAARLPQLEREVTRLDGNLNDLDAELLALGFQDDVPSPIEVIADPYILSEAVNKPRLQWAAIGMLAAIPLAALAAALVRRRRIRRI